jgi:hypothetical protein
VHEAELLDKMMEMHEEIIIWKIKKSKASSISKIHSFGWVYKAASD